MRILLSGFEPFGDLKLNPTQLLMERLSVAPERFKPVQLQTRVLETAYREAEVQWETAMHDFQPHIFIGLGVNAGASSIQLECLAHNLDQASRPDTRGEVREYQVIDPTGPPVYSSRLPLEAFYGAFQQAGVPVSYSESAGGYVCNHLFYWAMHWAARHAWPGQLGFLHVPLVREVSLEATLTLAELEQAMISILQIFQKNSF